MTRTVSGMVTRRRDRVYLRSGTSLAALTFEAANPLLPPLITHDRSMLFEIACCVVKLKERNVRRLNQQLDSLNRA
jgi:hypothetical protein